MQTSTTPTTAPISKKHRVTALLVLLAGTVAGILMLLVAAPAEARPMLNPCQYDDTCVTTTVRR